MELAVKSTTKSGNLSPIQVSDKAFASDFNEGIVHQVVVAYQAAARAGTAAQRNRSEVRGGGAKPWRQKGTGRARAGTSSSPIWRSGGVTFAAKTRDYTQKVNKKMYAQAIRSILSELVRKERLLVVERFDIAEPKTKLVKAQLDGLGDIRNALIIDVQTPENLYLAARNIPNVTTMDWIAARANPVALLRHDYVIITVDAVKQAEESLQ